MIDHHQGWNFRQWISALRVETVRIRCNTVILYLEKVEQFDVPPLKNGLQTMCKIIRQHQRGARIFISNLFPKVPGNTPGKLLPEINFVILQAVRSGNQALGKTHYLSTYEHFVSRKRNKVIQPTHQYFRENGHLTTFSCMVLRECFLREAGLKTYWF